MSKGSPIVKLRLPGDLQAQVEQEIERTNCNRAAEPFTVSTWIRAAIVEKLAHARRSRCKKSKEGACVAK